MSLWTIEFHCHTHASRDSLLAPSRLVEWARHRKLDRVVITDHNRISGALAAKMLDPDLVIVGEEILTTRGELLAAFVQEEVPAMLSPMETIHRLREQNAFISVSHPFDTGRNGWQLQDLLKITPYVDAVEVFNARCMSAKFNQMAAEFARELDLAGTAGSDAHTAFEIGRAVMRLPAFEDADSLRAVIRSAEMETNLSSPLVHFTSFWARKMRRWARLA